MPYMALYPSKEVPIIALIEALCHVPEALDGATVFIKD